MNFLIHTVSWLWLAVVASFVVGSLFLGLIVVVKVTDIPWFVIVLFGLALTSLAFQAVV